MNDYDYVIVGGGTAACVLANRLSENPDIRVLMLEAGPEPRNIWIKVPAGFSKLLTNPVYNWQFETQPQDSVNGRKIAIPRGRGLGGSTLINGMIYVRGLPHDYDNWVNLGATGWSAKEMMPYFHKIENYVFEKACRGNQGPVHVDQVRERYPIAAKFLDAAEQAGHPWNDDYNGDLQDGFGYYQVTQHRGARWSAYDAYLKPVLKRPNLQIMTHAFVNRLICQGTDCTGVSYSHNGSTTEVRAHSSVLLCAGAIQSPQLLEVSGIGKVDLIGDLGISVVKDLPGVGENYLDHFATRMNWRVQGLSTLNETSKGLRLIGPVLRYMLKRRGFLSMGTGLVHGFVRTRANLPGPDVQYFFMHASYANAAVRKLDSYPGMTVGVTGLRPTSKGSIHVQSHDPRIPPTILPNFLSTEEDQRTLIDGMKMARTIVEQPALSAHIEYEMNPGENVQSDDEWLHFARMNGQTVYHPVGTCRMGNDKHAVVDPRLRVIGMRGLRIVDASVFPDMISGNTQAAVMAVAERASDLILEDQRKTGL